MSERLTEILEACYLALQDGREPDLDKLCGSDGALRDTAARLLARERRLLQAGRPVAAVASAPAEPAEWIGEFRILDLLGSGGMGRVFRAHQPSLDRDVALKVLREEVIDTDAARLRLQREATVTAALDHPNIVPVYATGEDRGRTYIVMKLLRGAPLDRQSLPMEPERVARIGVAVAGALDAAHQIGVVHRDVKPANVLLEIDTPYVVDFGLARLASPTTALTQGHAAPGTLAYMAPELLAERAPVFDPRVDVYGLGATLYEILSGRPPFDDDLPVRLLRKVLFVDPPALRLPGGASDLETIVLRALDKAPSRRFATAAEMAAELERYLAGEPIRSHPIGPLRRMWRKARRRPGLSALVVTAAASLVVLAGVIASREIERHRRYARDVAAIEQTIAEGDVSEGRILLANLRDDLGDRQELIGLVDRLDQEADLRTLTLLVQSPNVHRTPDVLFTLANRLRDVRSPRARLVVAVVDALGSERPRAALDASLRRSYPRTAVAWDALAADKNVSDALARVTGSGGSTDLLFASLALRLQKQPASLQEQELGQASLSGPETDAIQFSRAIALEGMGQLRAAYLELEQLAKTPLHAAVALTARARLAGSLNLPGDAAAHLAAARAAIGSDGPEYLRAFLAMAELQNARDAEDPARFWTLWREAKPLLDRFPFFWLLAGNAAEEDGDLLEARRYLQAGIDLDPDGAFQLGLRATLVQVDWLLNPLHDASEPLTGEATAGERLRLADLAVRASELAADARAAGARLVTAEALLTEARCRRAIGDRRAGWQLLERVCREFSTPEALTAFSYLVTYRVLLAHLSDDDDDDVLDAGDLDQAVLVARERALDVSHRARHGDEAALDALDLARSSLLACSFHSGDAQTALPLAHELLAEAEAPDEAIPVFCQHAIEWGGLPLGRLLERGELSADRAVRLLRDALAALRQVDWLSADQVKGTLERWRNAVAPATGPATEPWAAVLRELDEFAAASGERRRDP